MPCPWRLEVLGMSKSAAIVHEVACQSDIQASSVSGPPALASPSPTTVPRAGPWTRRPIASRRDSPVPALGDQDVLEFLRLGAKGFAMQCGVSERTLRRKLLRAGVQLQQVMKARRRELALDL